MATKRGYFINAVTLIDLEGATNVPTAVLYHPDGTQLVGSHALASAQNASMLLNDNFKVDVGNFDPTASQRTKFPCADGVRRSSAQMAADFIHHVLDNSTTWLASQAVARSPSVLLAEPLAMHTELAEQGWLSNYRRSLERILVGKGFDKDKIDFLPEPFAVFQYYRYGIKHPAVAEQTKHNALVLDFGGGTFDVCVVSTSRQGDVSRSGRNSRPLAAASIPRGGFYINRLVAEHLLRKTLDRSLQGALKESLQRYRRWRSGQLAYDDVGPRDQTFFLALRALVQRVEEAKIALSRSVISWNLDSSSNQTVPVPVPENPFEPATGFKNATYSLAEFRTLFVGPVWGELKRVVQSAISRAREELAGGTVHVILLSGGSANIGWLRELVLRDFRDQLEHARVLQLPDFQEVVSKGLAIECARRFYSEGGDFAGTTYNRLCLLLSPDGHRSLPRFAPRTTGVPKVSDSPGVLLPAASVLRNFVDSPVVWRVKMERKPKRRLGYWFLRSSLDPDDTDNLQNLEQRSVVVPGSAKSRTDREIRVQLTVSEDGTARPRFIFRSGRDDSDSIYTDGRPFYLDMTFNRPEHDPKAYLGFDFGTSNSCISYVDQRAVEVYEERSRTEKWSSLNEMMAHLPFPAAEALGRYLGQRTEMLTQSARECVEATLAIASYSAYAEVRTRARARTKLFRGFTQRSAGPLWKLLQESVGQLREPRVVDPFREVLGSELREFMNLGIDAISQEKHEKAEAKDRDNHRLVQILAQTLTRCTGGDGWLLGAFENVQRRAFSSKYVGLFRVHHGSPPFTYCFEYEGSKSFSWQEPFLLEPEGGVVLSLLPLMFWGHCKQHPDLDIGHLYLFDRQERDGDVFSYKASGARCSCTVTKEGTYGELWQQLRDLGEADKPHEFMAVGSFREVEETQW